MNTRTWINIGLFLFIVLLSIFLVSEEEVEEELPRLTNFDKTSISNITVTRKDLEDFSFNKQDKSWYMSAPLQLKANEARINAMLRLLESESHAQLNPDEVELEQFDLVNPVISMKFDDHKFLFGNTDAIDQRRYVLFNNKIYMVNDFLYNQLTTNAAFFADPKLLPDNIDIKSIEFPDNQLKLVDGQWQLQKLLDINPNQLMGKVFAWKNAAAISVSKYEPAESKTKIILSINSEESIEFIIVSTEPHLILARADLGIQYHMGSDDAEKLLLHDNNSVDDSTSETTE